MSVRNEGEKFVTIFMLCIISILLICIMRLLMVIKSQNYIKMQMTVEENGWSEDKAKEIVEIALGGSKFSSRGKT